MAINVTLPQQVSGQEYRECITLTGTGPFKIESHNLGKKGEAQIVGDTLCITVYEPKAAFDFAAAVSGACSGCKPITVKSEIGFSSSNCLCTPTSFANSTVTTQARSSGAVNLIVPVVGTGEGLEFCGDSMPKCLKAELVGSTVYISGKLQGATYPVIFPVAVKNKCSCDCATIQVTIEAP